MHKCTEAPTADCSLPASCSSASWAEMRWHWHSAPSRGRSVRAPRAVQWHAEQRVLLDGNRTVALG